MAPFRLEGETLGEKHRYYNKVVKDATNNKSLKIGDFNAREGDIDKIFKIDVASNKRDVEYILEVLRSEDMLYVSRAIRRCVWLITEPQYAHIVNPDYLHTQLFPQMTAKASNKLMNNIILHLKDEARAEQFYLKEKNVKKAAKWLPNCSAAFIEQHIIKHAGTIKIRLLKRICEKSFKTLEILIKQDKYLGKRYFDATRFLLNVDAGRYLDLIESGGDYSYSFPKFGTKTTQILMEKFPRRIIDKFFLYCQHIHLETFVKYLKSDDVKKILYTLTKRQYIHHTGFIYNFKKLKIMINALSEDERFLFVDQVFINKIHTNKDNDDATEKFYMRQLCLEVLTRIPVYKFYEFAPFDVAFAEIKKLIQAEPSPDVKSSMLAVLITCARRKLENVRPILQYYRDKHHNDQLSLKQAFVNKILSETDFHKYDETTWNVLEDVYKSMGVYIESDVEKQTCVESIIVYKVVHDKKVPEIVEKQFKLNTLKNFEKNLNQEEKDRVLNYLNQYVFNKVQSQQITNEKEFQELISLLEISLDLLNDWNKEIIDYPWILDKIKECVKTKKDNSWNTSLASLYNKKKSWKKHMFEESLELYPSQEVCVNIIKHGPEQLSRHKNQVDALCRDNKVSLGVLLSKLRIYWQESLGSQWAGSYLGRLDELGGHKALIRGLCALLPQEQLLEILVKHAPQSAQVDWNETSELELSLQRHIAKNMHFARPQPTPDAILMYAKGDYLQYALPSLLAIFYNMTAERTRTYISRLLEAPVSIQKHGIRIAFEKLSPDELKQAFPDIWKITKNASIRAVIFKFTYDLICKETDPVRLQNIWESFAMFIDSLSYDEDKRIYELLIRDKIEKVPQTVRAEYLVKSYEFLKRLIPNLTGKDSEQYKYKLVNLTEYMKEMVEYLPTKFISDLLLEYIDDNFLKKELNDNIVSVISAYLLRTKDEKVQTERCNLVLVPLIERSIASWDKMDNRNYFIRKNFQKFLNTLRTDLPYVVKNNMVIPVSLYSNIQSEIIKLPVAENYMMLVKWRLTVELAKLVQQCARDNACNWDLVCAQVAVDFGDSCLRILKEDVKLYFSCIYLLFASTFMSMIEIFPSELKWLVFKRLTMDQQCVEAYLALIKEFPRYSPKKEESHAEELRKILLAHPSVEVKMHCYHKFKRED